MCCVVQQVKATQCSLMQLPRMVFNLMGYANGIFAIAVKVAPFACLRG
jgi:hypothetical protein